MSAGYSGKSIAEKLGYKPGWRVLVIGRPRDLKADLAGASVEITTRAQGRIDAVHAFVNERAVLARDLRRLMKTIPPDGMIWISWPKKASKMPTDVTEDAIRAVALPLGLVDVKVCAVDDVWSGLKLVLRKSRR
jgi:hypothetical protein